MDTSFARAGPLAPLQQSERYAQAIRAMGTTARAISGAGAPVWMVERRFPLLGRAALVSRADAAALETLGENPRRALAVRHLVWNAEDDQSARRLSAMGYWRVARPRAVAELDLEPPPARLEAGLSGKWRNRLRHGARQRLSIGWSTLPLGPDHWVFAADAGQARRLGYRPLPASFVCAFAGTACDAAQVFVARRGGTPEAAMLFLRHGSVATYAVGWLSARARTWSAGQVLMWEAVLSLRADGVRRVDLGDADPVHAAGLAHFKLGTGAVSRRLGGTWIDSGALPGAVGQRRRLRPVARPVPATAAHATAAPPQFPGP